MKQILLVHDVFPPRKGGSGRWLYELYRRFPKGTVHALAHDEPGSAEFDRGQELPITRMPLRFASWDILPGGGMGEYARAAWRIRREARRTGAEVLHVGKALPEGFLAWMLKGWLGLPYVCYTHGEELTLAKTSRDLTWMTRRALRGASRVIANCRRTASVVERDWGVARSRIQVMHPGVDTTCFVPAPASDAVRERLGWKGRTVIVTVGALQKRKGQDMMLRALPAIRQRFPNVLYVLAGEGRERPYLDGIVAELGLEGNVQFRGIPADDELIQCYQQCDLFALANRQVDWDIEGFGIVLLEAQACGKPVLAGASGGTVETMRPDVTGCVVPCEQPEPLAAAVIDLLADAALRERMGAAGRTWVVENLDWVPLVRQALAVFGMGSPPHRIQESANDFAVA